MSGERFPLTSRVRQVPGLRRLLRNRQRRTRIGAAIAISLLAVVYLSAAFAYSASLNDQEIQPLEPPPGGVAVIFVEKQIDAEVPVADAYLLVQPAEDLLNSRGDLSRHIQVSVSPTLNAEEIDYPRGTVPQTRTVTVPLRGAVQDYPFDVYTDRIAVAANAVLPDPSGEGRITTPLPVKASLAFRDSAWRLNAEIRQASDYTVIFDQSISRAQSTVAITLLLLGLMVVVAVLAAWMATSVVTGAVEAQVAVASWLAVMLFALVPLRNFLPGAPPIGSWIDILVFFWVEVGVMVCMVTVVVTLLARARQQYRHALQTEELTTSLVDADADVEAAAEAAAAEEPEDPGPR